MPLVITLISYDLSMSRGPNVSHRSQNPESVAINGNLLALLLLFSLFGRRRREEFVNQFRNMTSSFLPLPRPSRRRRRRMPQAKLQLLLLEFLFMVQSSFFVPIKLALHTYITLQFTLYESQRVCDIQYFIRSG